MLRKTFLYLFFIALGAVLLFGHGWLLALTSLLNHAPDVPTATGNATGAEVAAQAQAGGWVQAGVVFSKLLAAGAAYVFFIILIWTVQRLTHPEPTRWAKEDYSADFKGRPVAEKFYVYGNLRRNLIWLAIGCLIFGAYCI